MNAIMNNNMTPVIYFLIFLSVYASRICYLIWKNDRVWLDDLAITFIISLTWCVSLPAMAIWKISKKIDKYFFL